MESKTQRIHTALGVKSQVRDGKIENQNMIAQSTNSESSSQPRNHGCFVIFFAGTSAVLFTLSTIVVLLLYFPTKQLLNPDFYKQRFANHQIYQRLPEYVAQNLANDMRQDPCSLNLDSPECLNGDSSASKITPSERSPVHFLILNQQEWETILIDLIEPAWLQTQTESVIDQIFHILLVSNDPVNTSIDVSLKDVKSRLAGEEGTRAFLEILDAQDSCSLEQVLGLLQRGFGLPSRIDTILCRPPDYVISELTPIIQSFLINVVNLIPEQVSINPVDTFLDATSSDSSPLPESPSIPYQIQALRTYRKTISLSPLVPFLLISLVTIIAVRSWRDLFIWWGISFLSSGLITLLLAISILPIRNWALTQIFTSDRIAFAGLSSFLIQLGFNDMIRAMTNQLLLSIVIPAGLLTILGLFLLSGLIFLRDQGVDRSDRNPI